MTPPDILGPEHKCMIGLICLEVYNSISSRTKKISNFQLYTHHFDELSLKELKNELEESLGLSKPSPMFLRYKRKRAHFVIAHKQLVSEKSNTDGYITIIMDYGRTSFRDFECYFRIVVGLDEENIQLIPKMSFIIYHL